jgi:1,4-alpha-glucan branching enzyme
MESHDEERLMFKNISYGNSSGSYHIQDTTIALQRQQMVGAFFFTYPGPKMIWQFGELGYDYSIDYNGRCGEKPIRWDYLDQPDRERLFKTWAALINLRNQNEVFTSAYSVNLWLNDTNGRKRISLTHPSMNVIIVGNFGVTDQTIDPSFIHPGIWYDYFSGDSLIYLSGCINMNLHPGQFHIFTDKRLPTPEAGLIVGIEEPVAQIPLQYQLQQNYPNPFNPLTTISFEIPQREHVYLLIYNILGQRVKTLADKVYQPGRYRLIWDGTGESGEKLASGIYFLQLKAGEYIQNRRMVLLK